MVGHAYRDGPEAPGSVRRVRQRRVVRAVTVAGSVLVHLGVFALFLRAQPETPRIAPSPAIDVSILPLPKPPDPPPPPATKTPKPAAPARSGGKAAPAPPAPASASRVRPTPPPLLPFPTLAASPKPKRQAFLELGEGDALAAGSGGGAGAGSGSGSNDGAGGDGGSCDMRRRLQAALAKDARVRAAITGALGDRASTGRGMVVWNGDWVTSQGEDGKGLAAVRQAILWEVGFAPKACRERAVRGYVVVDLEDRTRIALGTGAWRWSDLLGIRR